jgi:hypothetical protein
MPVAREIPTHDNETIDYCDEIVDSIVYNYRHHFYRSLIASLIILFTIISIVLVIGGLTIWTNSCRTHDKCPNTKHPFKGPVYYWNIVENKCPTDYGMKDCWSAQVYASSNYNITASNNTQYLIPSGCSYEYITNTFSYQEMIDSLSLNFPIGSNVKWRKSGNQICTNDFGYSNYNYFTIGKNMFFSGIFLMCFIFVLAYYHDKRQNTHDEETNNSTILITPTAPISAPITAPISAPIPTQAIIVYSDIEMANCNFVYEHI